ncbi:hypothetical protein Patl1_28430 [Pistacia atlantica]|uniref:Uncharacterized protein n=1 Tax=Pistacia atlantica TaxID=434234 RepID=A0ACC1BC03_9ROSI|nr:hypothetical protein Patl1_28430 [Pistacia atlantica]
MEIASAKWLSDLGTEDSTFFHQEQMNPLDNQLTGVNFLQITHSNHGFYAEAPSRHPVVERSAKQTNGLNSCTADHITSNALVSSQIISFGNSTSSPPISQLVSGTEYAMIPKNEPRTPLHAQEHLVAERKRREKLCQRLIALSALVPGLKKTDKASVLGDAVKYLKQLQERVKKLEEQAVNKTMESKVVVKKSLIFIEGEESSLSDEKSYRQSNQYLPEIEARVSDRDVLVRIHCEKNDDCIVNILTEIEKHNLTVAKSNVLPFGNSTLDITVVAQMDVEFSMTVKDLVKNLRLALLHPSATKKLC